MRLCIDQKYRIISQMAGSHVLLPGTDVSAQIFPTKIAIQDKMVFLGILEPVQEFTITQDLEKRCVFVSGKSEGRYFCFKLFTQDKRVILKLDRSWDAGIAYTFQEKKGLFKRKDTLVLTNACQVFPPFSEKLFLGVSKALNWEKICERMDLKEMLPFWYLVGQMSEEKLYLGEETLLRQQKLSEDVLQDQKMLEPQISAKKIRSLFVQQDKHILRVLPQLPNGFVSGRMIDVQCESFGSMDFEWTKGIIKRLVFRAQTDAAIHWDFSQVRQYRFQDVGISKKLKMSKGLPTQVFSGHTYLLDHFEK